MRMLSFDLGNSSLGVGTWQADELHSLQRIPLADSDAILSLRERCERHPVPILAVASHGRALPGWPMIRWVGAEIPAPGIVEYEDPEELGLDRRVAAFAALASHGPSLVIDCGTCVTFTGIDREGRIHGHAISAGLSCLARGIATAAPALAPFLEPPFLDPASLEEGSRSNLVRGVRSGWRGLLAGLLEESLDRARASEEGRGKHEEPAILWTGTDAALGRELLGVGEIKEALVHHGLHLLGAAALDAGSSACDG